MFMKHFCKTNSCYIECFTILKALRLKSQCCMIHIRVNTLNLTVLLSILTTKSWLELSSLLTSRKVWMIDVSLVCSILMFWDGVYTVVFVITLLIFVCCPEMGFSEGTTSILSYPWFSGNKQSREHLAGFAPSAKWNPPNPSFNKLCKFVD